MNNSVLVVQTDQMQMRGLYANLADMWALTWCRSDPMETGANLVAQLAEAKVAEVKTPGFRLWKRGCTSGTVGHAARR